MKIIKPSYEILTPINGDELKMIEIAGRTCYKSENKITNDSANKFVTNLIKNGHEAMLEHGSLTVKFICDRGVSHELVRHRLASFAQESTRYCNYSKEKFGSELTFIWPCFFGEYNNENATKEASMAWRAAMLQAQKQYFAMLECGCTPQEARSVLPNSIKTEVVMTANYREWRHFFKLRAVGTSGKPHPQMEELTAPLLRNLTDMIPAVFDDIYEMWWMNQSDAVNELA